MWVGVFPMQNSMLELEQSIVPSTLSLLTISDCNLCALLSMVQTSESTKALLTQLTEVLNQNVERASTLEEAIEMNNNGLPEDMFKDTRSRKTRICNSSKKDMEPALQAAMNNLCSDAQGESSSKVAVDLSGSTNASPSSSSTSAPPPPTTTSSSSSVVSMSIGSTQNADVLNVLSKSPHIIVCCPKQGSLSYILTLPTSSSTPPVPPGRRILPSPNGLDPTPTSGTKQSVLTKKSAEKGKVPNKKSDKVGKSPQSGSSLSSKVVKDYDAEKFSKFANILVNMDGVEGLQSEGAREENGQSQPWQNRTRLLTSSGSDGDVEFTDSLESDASVTHQTEPMEDNQEELMDFASIVSSAVGPNSEVPERGHPALSLPEVPMAWLDITTSSHQSDTDAPQTHLSDASLTTASVTSSNTTVEGSADVRIDKPLPASSTISSTTHRSIPPQPQFHLTPGSQLHHTPPGHVPPGPQLSHAPGRNDSLSNHDSAVLGQHMADAEGAHDTQSSDNFLNVSLDLDSESLQQLLTLSHSPELQQSQPAMSTDTPLSPISQLFDRLEPPDATINPGALSPTDSRHHSTTTHKRQHNPDSSQTNPNGQTNIVDPQQSVVQQNQNVASFGTSGGHPLQIVVSESGSGEVATTSWTPSPNSLQHWLESTSGKSYCVVSFDLVTILCLVSLV